MGIIGIAVLGLNLGGRWVVASFTPRLPYPRYASSRGLGGPHW